MRPLWVALLVACNTKDATRVPSTGTARPASTPTSAAEKLTATPTASASRPEADRCSAPSLVVRGDLDGRDDAALGRCLRPPSSRNNDDCGMGESVPALGLRRLDEAVPALDEATRAHIAEIAKKGEGQGRKRRAFGLVGDSMTVSTAFLSDLSKNDGHTVQLAPDVAAALAAEVEGRSATIIDFYRGAEAQRIQGVWFDSFRASRAARVGARASWALMGGAQSPLALMIERISPAVAIVLYGGNDAAWRIAPSAAIADEFERDLSRILDELEKQGIIPVLNTVARHGHAPGLDDCEDKDGMSNWRIAVQTSAVSAKVVAIACKRHLPLIDLRWALDAAPLSGLGHDGVHLNGYRGGHATIDARSLQCGNSIRNYVTLKMLARIKEALVW
jgi:hypothetical protein